MIILDIKWCKFGSEVMICLVKRVILELVVKVMILNLFGFLVIMFSVYNLK